MYFMEAAESGKPSWNDRSQDRSTPHNIELMDHQGSNQRPPCVFVEVESQRVIETTKGTSLDGEIEVETSGSDKMYWSTERASPSKV